MLGALLIIMISIMMAKGRRRGGARRMSKYIRGVVDEDAAVGALATQVVILSPFSETVSETMRVSSVVATWALEGHTAGEGPLIFGVSHSDYTAAEVQEYLDVVDSWAVSDLIAQEVSRRKIRVVGSFDGNAVSEKFNDGRPVKTKLNWRLATNQTLEIFILNKDDDQLTTGSAVIANGHANLWLA